MYDIVLTFNQFCALHTLLTYQLNWTELNVYGGAILDYSIIQLGKVNRYRRYLL